VVMTVMMTDDDSGDDSDDDSDDDSGGSSVWEETCLWIVHWWCSVSQSAYYWPVSISFWIVSVNDIPLWYSELSELSTDVSEVRTASIIRAPLKRRSTIILHGSITQKTALNIILAAVRTLNLTQLYHMVV
jgi:hypothetical protein